MLNIDKIRKDFPILKIQSNNKPLIFFDNGASSQKPQVVLDKINEIYKTKYANIHRGIYDLSQKATEAYEESRKKIQKFINAKSEKEIVFVRGATEGINLVAQSYGLKNFKNLTRWYLEITKREAVIKGYDFMNRGEVIPKP